MSRGLEHLGYDVQSFEGARAFLDKAVLFRPAVLLIDMQMPDVNGVQLQASLLHKGWGVPIIFISGESTVQQSIAAMKQGAHDFMVKPFDLDKLLKERRKRAASGKDPTLPFDHAPPSSWAMLGEASMAERIKATSGVQPLGAASGASSGAGRMVAGKEVGCLFYFLFHSAFIEDDLLRVPLPMMDKAFKNKKGIYRPDGVTVLRFQPDGAAAADAV